MLFKIMQHEYEALDGMWYTDQKYATSPQTPQITHTYNDHYHGQTALARHEITVAAVCVGTMSLVDSTQCSMRLFCLAW